MSEGVLELNTGKVLSYLQEVLPLIGLVRPMSITIDQFKNGQSNPTYLLSCNTGKYVLRKAPPGVLLKGAHNVNREARMMQSIRLANPSCPVPHIYIIEDDIQILGTKFYIMEYVDGTVYRNPSLPDVSADKRRTIYYDLAALLASVHNTSPMCVSHIVTTMPQGTSDFCKRQIRVWSQQYARTIGDISNLPKMQQVLLWLQENIPSSTDISSLSVVHGDFRLDNVIYGSNGPLALLDWEISGVGDGNVDLAYCCLGYYLPKDGVLSDFALDCCESNGTSSGGIPSMKDFIAAYKSWLSPERARRVPEINSEEWTFFLCLGLYRIASICAGVYSRALQGNASRGNKALDFKHIVPKLAQLAQQLISASKQPKIHRVESLEIAIPSGLSAAGKMIYGKLRTFMNDVVIPLEARITQHNLSVSGVWPKRGSKWEPNPLIEKLRTEAQRLGLWNMWMTNHIVEDLKMKHPDWPWNDILPHKFGISNLDYAYIAMETGRSLHGAEACNCMAPDTGNMEILAKFGTTEQKEKWLLPLLQGHIRSCFGMTEPMVASSDPTQLQTKAVQNKHGWVLNGRKWWTTGACDPRCAVCIIIAVTGGNDAPSHARHSFLLVPMNHPGVTVERPLHVFGYDDSPSGHAETSFRDIIVPFKDMIGEEGLGFALAQSRLGPGRLHHCCRLLGHCERALQEVVRRGTQRQAFGKALLDLGANNEKLALNRVSLRQAQLAAVDAANELDIHDLLQNREKQLQAAQDISQQAVKLKLSARAIQALAVCKIACPRVAQQCLDYAIQIHGGGGLGADHPLAGMWTAARTLRLVDGPDEVHLFALSRAERKEQLKLIGKDQGIHPGVGNARL